MKIGEAVLRDLAKKSWAEYRRFEHTEYIDADGVAQKFVVQGSMPILYFGDLPAYQESDVRVVTAALNPSDAEFPNEHGDMYQRFPLMRGKAADEEDVLDQYLKALNGYFREKPYCRWFGCMAGGWQGTFEPILNGMETSYYGNLKQQKRFALHTDVISPVATSPVCSKLRPRKLANNGGKVIDAMAHTGTELWLELIEVLRPDITLLAIAPSGGDFRRVGLPEVSDWHVIYTKPDSDNTDVRGLKVQFPSGLTSLFVTANKGGLTPFCNFKNVQKPDVGRAIMDFYRSDCKDTPAHKL